MREPIEFEVLFWEKEQNQLNGLGIRPDISDASTRPVTFYNIDCFHLYYESYGTEMCCIFCGGEEYIVDMSYKQVKQLLT